MIATAMITGAAGAGGAKAARCLQRPEEFRRSEVRYTESHSARAKIIQAADRTGSKAAATAGDGCSNPGCTAGIADDWAGMSIRFVKEGIYDQQ